MEATWWILAPVGLAAGVLSSLMGIGGGLVMVPALHYGLAVPWPKATALSLLAIAVQAPLGIWRHHRRGAVDLRLAPGLAAGGAIGVALGAWSQRLVPVPALKVLFAAVMLYAAYRMVRPVAARDDGGVGPALAVLVGLAAGVIAKWLGIGGGLLTVPVLALSGVAVHVAVGTSLVPVWTNALVASVVNARAHLVGWEGIVLGVGALAGAPLGVWIAHALPAHRLRAVLAVLLAVAALGMAATSDAWPAVPAGRP